MMTDERVNELTLKYKQHRGFIPSETTFDSAIGISVRGAVAYMRNSGVSATLLDAESDMDVYILHGTDDMYEKGELTSTFVNLVIQMRMSS